MNNFRPIQSSDYLVIKFRKSNALGELDFFSVKVRKIKEDCIPGTYTKIGFYSFFSRNLKAS